MTALRRPLVIVTLPARSASEARTQIDRAAAYGADVAEVRFDRWPATEWENVHLLQSSPLPLLATLRSRAEGGEGPDSAADRDRWRERVGREPFAYIDLEAARDPPRLGTGEAPRPSVIRSAHLPQGSPPSDVHQTLARLSAAGTNAKLVVPASDRTDLREIVPELPPPGEGRFIVQTTGPSGPLLRAVARRLGLAAVFASLPVDPDEHEGPVEPAQIPVDRLVPFLSAEPFAPLFAVIGRPVGHSLSPSIHHGWLRAEGRVGLYIPLEIADERELADVLPPLAEMGMRGINVTHPFKAAALALADDAAAGAVACGCANTLTFTEGRLEAENTDLAAILRRLGELRVADRWDGQELLVVGSGGSARATLAAARLLGVRAFVLARSPVAMLVEEFGAVPADPSAAHPISFIVHATPVGRAGEGPLDVDLAPWVGPSTYLLDFVYRAESSEIADLVGARGGRYEDGRRLLAYSAAASYGRWWGSEPAASLVERAAEGAA